MLLKLLVLVARDEQGSSQWWYQGWQKTVFLGVTDTYVFIYVHFYDIDNTCEIFINYISFLK